MRTSLTYRDRASCTFAKAIGFAIVTAMSAGGVQARSADAVARFGMTMFAKNCFSPFMTAAKAETLFNAAGVSYDFYDLDPFSSAAPSPALGRDVTQGTDRRCEISFDGAHGPAAAQIAIAALDAEGITTPADIPAGYEHTPTTHLLAARRLNPRRVAVVHVGTRTGASGTETFMLVERLLPNGGKG